MVNQTEELEKVKKELDLANEEIQLLNLKNEKLKEIEQSHKKLVGKLYSEIDELKKEAKEILNYP